MTKAQVNYTVTQILGDSMDTWTYLPNAKCINLSKQERKWCDKKINRFYFNSTYELLECLYIREYSRNGSIPSHGNYDIITDENGVDVIYERLCDSNGNLLKDVYSFESILLFEI